MQACAPGGVADADGGFANRVLDLAISSTRRVPTVGSMEFPTDWLRANWGEGEVHALGGEPYQLRANPNYKKVEKEDFEEVFKQLEEADKLEK